MSEPKVDADPYQKLCLLSQEFLDLCIQDLQSWPMPVEVKDDLQRRLVQLGGLGDQLFGAPVAHSSQALILVRACEALRIYRRDEPKPTAQRIAELTGNIYKAGNKLLGMRPVEGTLLP